MQAQDMAKWLAKLKMALPKWAPKEIDANLASLWAFCLKDFPDQTIKDAFVAAMGNLTEWPSPATIKRYCQGSLLSDEEIGQDVAARIESAIGKYGYTSPDRAQEHVGEIGWEVVRQLGGWNNICECTTDQLPSVRRQWRDLATTLSKKFHAIGENAGPALPKKPNSPALQEALRIIHG